MSSLDIYKVPREKVDVEAIAQGMARYLKMTAEDAEYLSYDPARRDAIIAELYEQEADYENALKVSESGVELVRRVEQNWGRPLKQYVSYYRPTRQGTHHKPAESRGRSTLF